MELCEGNLNIDSDYSVFQLSVKATCCIIFHKYKHETIITLYPASFNLLLLHSISESTAHTEFWIFGRYSGTRAWELTSKLFLKKCTCPFVGTDSLWSLQQHGSEPNGPRHRNQRMLELTICNACGKFTCRSKANCPWIPNQNFDKQPITILSWINVKNFSLVVLSCFSSIGLCSFVLKATFLVAL